MSALIIENAIPVRLPASCRPILVVGVDTEEEFDWNAPFDRSATGTTAMREVWRLQELCESFGIKPVYVLDYPVAAQPENLEHLLAAAKAGRAIVGAHLHPWVNPPFEEAVNARNSYLGNLAPELQRAKLEALVARIEATFGLRPAVFKAGRYGLGPETSALIEELGFEFDMSVSSAFDHSDDGGPDFSGYSAELFWFGPQGRVLEIPTTGGFAGYLANVGAPLYRLATRSAPRWTRAPGILSRTGALNRIRLSPEGMTLHDNKKLTYALYRRGLRVFSFTLHSPSMKPGCTPYVRSEHERDRFLDHCRAYFDYFMGELGGVAMTVEEIRDLIRQQSAKAAA